MSIKISFWAPRLITATGLSVAVWGLYLSRSPSQQFSSTILVSMIVGGLIATASSQKRDTFSIKNSREYRAGNLEKLYIFTIAIIPIIPVISMAFSFYMDPIICVVVLSLFSVGMLAGFLRNSVTRG